MNEEKALSKAKASILSPVEDNLVTRALRFAERWDNDERWALSTIKSRRELLVEFALAFQFYMRVKDE